MIKGLHIFLKSIIDILIWKELIKIIYNDITMLLNQTV